MWDFPGVESYRRSGGRPSADQSLAPSDDHHEMRRKRPTWFVLTFSGLMIALAIWLLATNTGGPDGGPGPPAIVRDSPGDP